MTSLNKIEILMLIPKKKNSPREDENAKEQEDSKEDENEASQRQGSRRPIQVFRFTYLNILRRFRVGAKLHPLLSRKEPKMMQIDKFEYTLLTVLSAMRKIICREKLFDPLNSTMLKFSPEFIEALDIPWCHVTEVTPLVILQLELADPTLESEMAPYQPPAPSGPPLDPNDNFDVDGKFECFQKLR